MRVRLLTVAVAAAGLALLPASAALAHPLGNFTVNTADRLVVTSGGLTVQHVVDLAELPTVQLGQARAGVDTDRDGTLSPSELTAYAARECARVAPLLELQVDGRPAPLVLTGSTGTSAEGAAPGLRTTRLECDYDSGVRPRSQVAFTDRAADERNGWREVTAASDCGPLRDSSVPATSPSGLLRTYPEDLLQSPSNVTAASFGVAGGACTGSSEAGNAADRVESSRGLDRLSRAFTGFVNPSELSVALGVLAVLASVLFGALHALAPGHGKTVMAAYLVGQRGTRRQALQLGVFVTVSHTASVLLVGLLVTGAAIAKPELVVPATEVVSGVLLGAVGVYLLVLAVRRLRATPDHAHDHPHPHEHDHPHDHAEPARVLTTVGGPSPTPAAPLVHSHGGRAHSHAPLPEGRMSLRTLAAVGVAGGLVPSPSALLVLLGAFALGRPAYGVLLVLAYGVGMAATLTAAGLLLLRARAVADRRGWSSGRAARAYRLVPLFAAVVVLAVGAFLVLRGLDTGRPLL